jgi:hypothetical protein
MVFGDPVTGFLTDQGFPPILPTSDGKCAIVVRGDEGGWIFEFEKAFRDMFTWATILHGKFRVGSRSSSVPSRFGLESCTVDLVKIISSVSAVVREGVEVSWCLWWGCQPGADARHLRSWRLDHECSGHHARRVRELFREMVLAMGAWGSAACTGEQCYRLPSLVLIPRKKPFRGSALNPSLPN